MLNCLENYSLSLQVLGLQRYCTCWGGGGCMLVCPSDPENQNFIPLCPLGPLCSMLMPCWATCGHHTGHLGLICYSSPQHCPFRLGIPNQPVLQRWATVETPLYPCAQAQCRPIYPPGPLLLLSTATAPPAPGPNLKNKLVPYLQRPPAGGGHLAVPPQCRVHSVCTMHWGSHGGWSGASTSTTFPSTAAGTR